MTDRDFNMFAREVISDRQHTDESILDHIKHTNQRNIPHYPISLTEFLERYCKSTPTEVIMNMNKEVI